MNSHWVSMTTNGGDSHNITITTSSDPFIPPERVQASVLTQQLQRSLELAEQAKLEGRRINAAIFDEVHVWADEPKQPAPSVYFIGRPAWLLD